MAFEDSSVKLTRRIAAKPYIAKFQWLALAVLGHLMRHYETALDAGEVEFHVPGHDGFWADVSGGDRELILRHSRPAHGNLNLLDALATFKHVIVREALRVQFPEISELSRLLDCIAMSQKAASTTSRPWAQYRITFTVRGGNSNNSSRGLPQINYLLGRLKDLTEAKLAEEAAHAVAHVAVAEFLAKNLEDDEHVLLIEALTSYKPHGAEVAVLERVLGKVFPNHNIEIARPPKKAAPIADTAKKIDTMKKIASLLDNVVMVK